MGFVIGICAHYVIEAYPYFASTAEIDTSAFRIRKIQIIYVQKS